jgi:hypothetical protein
MAFNTWFSISVGITSSGGVITSYSFRLNQYLKPAKMKLFHNLVGVKSKSHCD